MAEKRQLTESEKDKVLQQHGRVCFIDGAPIPEDEPIEFHHVRPFSEGGPTNLDNIAPVCKSHHRSIGTMSLQECRDKIQLDHCFEDKQNYLDDILTAKGMRFGERLRYEIDGETIVVYFDDSPHKYPLYECPTTGWQYFYATLPVQYIKNDKELQPRTLRRDSMWSLYRHFRSNTQLAPSICRMGDGYLLLFDGQHKAAAQIWAGHPHIECKVYVEPDASRMKETNLEAHERLRQMKFYSHELTKKYADIFEEEWHEYMETEGVKSEKGFYNFLIRSKNKTAAQARREMSLAICHDIVYNSDNKLTEYVEEKSRGKKQPLTFARLKKAFLDRMLVPPPTDVDLNPTTTSGKTKQTT